MTKLVQYCERVIHRLTFLFDVPGLKFKYQ